MWAKWTTFYNRAKNAKAALSLFDRAWQGVLAGAAMLAWASSTWNRYWDTGVAFAFLVSCIGLALAFFLCGLGARLWRGNSLDLWSRATPGGPTSRVGCICHVRSSVYFDQLEDEGLIRLTLEFLNASAEEIALESANGHLSCAGINEKELHPVAWLDGCQPPRAEPFDDLPINFQQNPPSWVIHFLLEQARNGKPFSIKFHLQIKAKVLATGEVIELRSWDGVSCQTKNMPVVTGRLVSLIGTSS